MQESPVFLVRRGGCRVLEPGRGSASGHASLCSLVQKVEWEGGSASFAGLPCKMGGVTPKAVPGPHSPQPTALMTWLNPAPRISGDGGGVAGICSTSSVFFVKTVLLLDEYWGR